MKQVRRRSWRLRTQSSVLWSVTLLLGTITGRSDAQESHGIEPNLPLPEVPARVVAELGMEGAPAVPNYLRGWYYVPGTVLTTEAFQQAVFGAGPLDAGMIFMLNTVTSATNNCLYCLCAAVVMAQGAGVKQETIIAIQEEVSSAPLSDKQKALLRLAVTLTEEPGLVKPFVARAADHGWTHAEIAHAIQVTSTMNMNNRMAEAFGYPPDWMHPYDPDTGVPIRDCGTQEQRARLLKWFGVN